MTWKSNWDYMVLRTLEVFLEAWSSLNQSWFKAGFSCIHYSAKFSKKGIAQKKLCKKKAVIFLCHSVLCTTHCYYVVLAWDRNLTSKPFTTNTRQSLISTFLEFRSRSHHITLSCAVWVSAAPCFAFLARAGESPYLIDVIDNKERVIGIQ